MEIRQKCPQGPAQHDWLLKTFPEPTQCMQCATYLTGVYRQGIFCQKCGYSSHYKCSKNVPGMTHII